MVDILDETENHLAAPSDSASQFKDIVGDMYARWTLDCVVEIAYQVSLDFVGRPEFYKSNITADVGAQIVRLRMEYGTKVELPNSAQRGAINTPIFGPSDGVGPIATVAVDKFRSLRKPLLDACTTFSERTVVDADQGIKQAILSALDLFQLYLNSYDGASIRAGHDQIVDVSNVAYSVLRSSGIAQVFGVNSPIGDNWPLASNDPNGALLIRAICEKLQLTSDLVFTDERFQRLRRLAQQGELALESIIDGVSGTASDEDFGKFVTSVYTWAVALRDYGISY
jgi:hypothetical protein